MSTYEPEFQQAVQEIEKTIQPYLDLHPEIVADGLLDRLKIPDRSIIFKVVWLDDNNKLQVNTGYRVQFNNAIGTYKGGIRFHPSVNLSIMKFLAYEQSFKNALTGLPMGGAKGGADFDPVGKSEGEIMRFTQSFMTELYKYLGSSVDVPAGDIGVGPREIGYMVGQYKRLTGNSEAVLTGKPLASGGSLFRPEAPGFGLVYMMDYAMKTLDESIKGKRVLVSGAGAVGMHAALKAYLMGAKVVGISNVYGTLLDESGLDVIEIKRLIFDEKLDLKDYLKNHDSAYYEPDNVIIYYQSCDVFLFCATQNEADVSEVEALIKNGCRFIGEGANMPLTNEAQEFVLKSKILYLPGKAANAGGVSVSLMEMSQNASFVPWSKEEVDQQLKNIMENIFDDIRATAIEFNDPGNYVLGANITGFKKIVEAMKQQGY